MDVTSERNRVVIVLRRIGRDGDAHFVAPQCVELVLNSERIGAESAWGELAEIEKRSVAAPAEGSVDVLGIDHLLRGAVFVVPKPLERGGVVEVGGEIDVDGGVEGGGAGVRVDGRVWCQGWRLREMDFVRVAFRCVCGVVAPQTPSLKLTIRLAPFPLATSYL